MPCRSGSAGGDVDADACTATCAVEELQDREAGGLFFEGNRPIDSLLFFFVETHASGWGRVDAMPARCRRPPTAVQAATGLVQWAQEHAKRTMACRKASRNAPSRLSRLAGCLRCCAFLSIACLNFCAGSPETKPMQRDGAALFVRPCPRGTEPPCVESSVNASRT